MNKINYHIILILLAGNLLTACNQDDSCQQINEGQTATMRVQIINADSSAKPFITQTRPMSPSLRAFSEDIVGNLHVAIYNNNDELTGRSYGSGASSIYVSTRSGLDCTVYALVNTGSEGLSIPLSRTALVAMTTPNITDIEDIKVNESLIMSGSIPANINPGENTLALLPVSRMAARNRLNITCSEGATLTGYAVKNLPVKSWYIPRPNDNETSPSDEAMGNDAVNITASTDWLNTPILTPTSTGPSTYTLTFYQYENRRGGRVSVAGTTGDPTIQTEKATYAPTRATYVELYVDAGGATSTYQLYLGADAYTNYSVKRNCSYTYTISINTTSMSIASIGIAGWTAISGEETIEL